MSNWSAMHLTATGRAVEAKYLSGQMALTFSKFAFGSGTLPEGEKAEDLTELVEWRQDVGISSAKPNDNGQMTIKGTLANTGVFEGYYVKEMGLYILDPEMGESVLYGYFYDTEPSYMPTKNVRYISRPISITIVPSGTVEVTAILDMDSVATLQDVAEQVSKAKLTFSQIYPVGAVYISTVATDPSELFSGTTWTRVSSGVMLLSAGGKYPAGSTGGKAEHKLTVDEMPQHSHVGQTDKADNHWHWESYGENMTGPYGQSSNRGYAGSGDTDYDNYRFKTSPAGAHTHTVTIKDTGGGAAHNNMPPYLAVYMWRRTA